VLNCLMEIYSIKPVEILAGVLEMIQLCCYSTTIGLISTVSQIKVSIIPPGLEFECLWTLLS